MLKKILLLLKIARQKNVRFLLRILLKPFILINYFLFFWVKPRKNYSVTWQPLGITVFTNNDCNMSCSFCGRHNDTFKRMSPAGVSSMTFDQFQNILKKLKYVFRINFCGCAESLLNPDIFKMISWAKKKNKIVQLYTNGLLLNKKNVELLLEAKINCIKISLKGLDAADFSAASGLNNSPFTSIIENIKNLLFRRDEISPRTKIDLCYVSSRDQIEKMHKVVKLANSLRIDTLFLMGLSVPNPLALKNIGKIFFASDQKLQQEFSELKKMAKVNLRLPPLIGKKTACGRCLVADGFITIDALGNTSPCCAIIPQQKYGNIFRDKNILNSASFTFFRRLISTNAPYACQRCTCFFNSLG